MAPVISASAVPSGKAKLEPSAPLTLMVIAPVPACVSPDYTRNCQEAGQHEERERLRLVQRRQQPRAADQHKFLPATVQQPHALVDQVASEDRYRSQKHDLLPVPHSKVGPSSESELHRAHP